MGERRKKEAEKQKRKNMNVDMEKIKEHTIKNCKTEQQRKN